MGAPAKDQQQGTAGTEKAPPLACRWMGEVFVPGHQWRQVAERHFVVGELYAFEIYEARSKRSHDHYFACIGEAWKNLPDGLVAEHFPSPEHLRKKALIKAGWRDERSITCASRAEALRVASFIKPLDDFALVIPHGATVTVMTAKSQSEKAMGKEGFQKSKDDVLAILSDIIGVDVTSLKKAA